MTEDTAQHEEHPTSETAETGDAATAVAEPFDDHFNRVDIEGFSGDDSTAGTAIGKMLALFFLYTVIVMSLSAWWTFSQTKTREQEEKPAVEAIQE